MSRSAWRSAELLDIVSRERGGVVSFDRCLEDNAVLRFRARELTRALLHLLGRKGRATLAPDRTAIAVDYALDGDQVLPAVRRSIDAIAARPCTPACIQQILGIRSMELARWTEAGRLRPIGSACAKRGSDETCLIYCAADIAALAARPETIASWRYDDARARGPFQAQAGLVNAHG